MMPLIKDNPRRPIGGAGWWHWTRMPLLWMPRRRWSASTPLHFTTRLPWRHGCMPAHEQHANGRRVSRLARLGVARRHPIIWGNSGAEPAQVASPRAHERRSPRVQRARTRLWRCAMMRRFLAMVRITCDSSRGSGDGHLLATPTRPHFVLTQGPSRRCIRLQHPDIDHACLNYANAAFVNSRPRRHRRHPHGHCCHFRCPVLRPSMEASGPRSKIRSRRLVGRRGAGDDFIFLASPDIGIHPAEINRKACWRHLVRSADDWFEGHAVELAARGAYRTTFICETTSASSLHFSFHDSCHRVLFVKSSHLGLLSHSLSFERYINHTPLPCASNPIPK
jgi:hypothetical protein